MTSKGQNRSSFVFARSQTKKQENECDRRQVIDGSR